MCLLASKYNIQGQCYAGQTASLVSKYRPPMPILTLVIPTLKNDGMKWTLVGRGVARQCQIQRGLLPVLAAPSPSGGAPSHRRRVCVATFTICHLDRGHRSS